MTEPTAATSVISSRTTTDETAVTADVRASARRRRVKVWAARLATLVIIIGGWQLLASAKIVDRFFWGQPSGIVSQLNDWVRHGTAYGSIWVQIWTTFKEAVLGFLFGVLAGVIIGVLLGQFRFFAEVLNPYIKVANAIPRIVLGSLFTVALGLGIAAKVSLAAVLVFFVVFFIASLHVAFGLAIIGAIVGEFLGAQKGLGLVIATAQNNFNPDGVFAAMFIIAVLALTAEGLIALLERRLLSWRPPSQAEAAAA